MLIKNYLGDPGPYMLMFDINMDASSTLLFSWFVDKIRKSIKKRSNTAYHLVITKKAVKDFVGNRSDFDMAIKNLSKKHLLKENKENIEVSIPSKVMNKCLDMYDRQAELDKKGLIEVPDSWGKDIDEK